MTGTTPINYLLTYRIERAARKLLGSDLSVTQIAYDCGFNDLSYFIKTFKTFKKVSPKDYRTS
jgi:AraC-like DNA-binding protein